jgi:hypothetical protein
MKLSTRDAEEVSKPARDKAQGFHSWLQPPVISLIDLGKQLRPTRETTNEVLLPMNIYR